MLNDSSTMIIIFGCQTAANPTKQVNKKPSAAVIPSLLCQELKHSAPDASRSSLPRYRHLKALEHGNVEASAIVSLIMTQRFVYITPALLLANVSM